MLVIVRKGKIEKSIPDEYAKKFVAAGWIVASNQPDYIDESSGLTDLDTMPKRRGRPPTKRD